MKLATMLTSGCMLVLLSACLSLASDLSNAKHLLSQWVETGSTHSDPMLLLRKEVRETFSRQDPGAITDIVRALTEVTVGQTVEVRLVGFDGDATSKLYVPDATLLRHLRALRADMDTVVLEPRLAALPVFPEISFKVSRGGTYLLQRINAALAQAAATDKAARPERLPGDHVLVPHQAVDDVLRTDQHRDASATLTIYLIAPHAMDDHGKYAYSYDGHGDRRAPCPGSHWVGNSRYMWIDISAGPVLYGPGMGHAGQVFQHTVPHPLNYKPSLLNEAIVPDLAALVWSAVQHHLWPPLQHGAIEHKEQVTIEIIHMHDTLGLPPDKISRADIESSLRAALGNLQIVAVHESWVSFAACDMCVSAYTGALRLRTERDETTPVVLTKQSRFLDAKAAHRMLASYQDSIYGAAGMHMDYNASHRILPVFVFDVSESEEAVMLSGGVQAAAFPDMVIAVTSRVGDINTHFTCGWDRVRVNSADITRQLLSAILTSGWGVANISTFYTPATGPGLNYLWSVGPTPFGPLGSALHLPAPLAAMLPRNLAVAALNQSANRISQVLTGFSILSKSGKIEKSVTQDYHQQVVGRLNVALYKATQFASSLSAAEYGKALKFALSMSHEAQALERLAVKVSRTLKSKMDCDAGPGLGNVWWAPVAALSLWPVARWLRSKIYKPKLEKMW